MKIIVVIAGLLLAQIASAISPVEHSIRNLSGGGGSELAMDVVDLRIKVQGGELAVTRHWQGDRWVFFPSWKGLDRPDHEYFTYQGVQYPAQGNNTQPIVHNSTLVRSGQEFRAKAASTSQEDNGGRLYSYTDLKDLAAGAYMKNLNSFIVNNEDGLLWKHRDGSRHQYDDSGRLQYFEDRNGNRYVARYDANGNLTGLKDQNDKILFTITYESTTIPAGTLTRKPGLDGEFESNEDQIAWRPTSVSDYSGRTVTYTYEGNRLTKATDYMDGEWQYEYDDNAYMDTYVDAAGFRYEMTLGSEGYLKRLNVEDDHYAFSGNTKGRTVTYPYGKTETTNTFYSSNTKTVQNLVNGKEESKTVYYYEKTDGTGLYRLKEYVEYEHGEASYKKVVDPFGNVTSNFRYADEATRTYQYHPMFDGVTETTDWAGIKTTYDYDEHGNLETLIQAVGTPDERVVSYLYDSAGNRKKTRFWADAKTEEAIYDYHYDQWGNVTQVDKPHGSIHFVNAEHPEHDVLGNAPVRVDELGNTWIYDFDLAGNATKVTDPLLRVTDYAYNATGSLTSLTRPVIGTEVRTVDYRGRPLTITNSQDQARKFSYMFNSLRSVALPGGEKEIYQYNQEHKLSEYIDASGFSTTYNYEDGQLASVDYPTYSEVFERNDLGQTIKTDTTTPDDSINQSRLSAYDARNNLSDFVDAENNPTKNSYDALGRLVSVKDARQGVTVLEYDDRDNLISVTDPDLSKTTFTYDASDHLVLETRPEGETRAYTYYANGLRKTETNGKGEITHFTYDAAGQLKNVKYFADQAALDNINAGNVVDFDYNDLGQLTHYDDGETVGDYTYNALGRLETVTINYGPFSKSHSYTYDANGRRKTYTNPEGITYTYHYTGNGDFKSLSIPDEGAITVTSYKWRAPQEWLFPGGTRIKTTTDGLLRPEDTALLDPAGNGKASRVYTYNQENHITGIATEDGHHTYTLDELYRLTAAAYAIETGLEDEAYTYDPVGNRITENGSEPWHYNANHQLEDRPGVVYAYDDNGHTISKTEGSAVTTYEYNLAERMDRVALNGETLGTYSYDPFGRRVSKTTASGTLYFHYDETGLLAEYDASGQLVNEYQYTPGSTWMTDPLFKRDAAGKVHYYYNSHLGQPLKLFDKAGKVTWAARSQAFGETTVEVNETGNALRFPGQYWDDEIKSHYNYFRDYDPEEGRYIQKDPIGLRGGLNGYIYVGGNPSSRFDPTGELFFLAPLAFVGGGATAGGVSAATATAVVTVAVGGTIVLANSGVEDPLDKLVRDAQRQKEYERVKQRCDKKPRKTGNRCSDLSKEIDHYKNCINWYNYWDRKWNPGRHAEKVQNWSNRVEKLKKQYKKECSPCR